MDISYLGHSSFKLRGRSASLVTDPYDPKKVGLKYKKVSADVITVSHQHDDHNFIEQVKEYKKVIAGPGEYEISGISVIGISTFHDDKRGEERGRNTVYVIEMDDVRLAHLGDLGHKLTEKVMEEMGNIDVLMIPVGGIYTINATQASEIVRRFEPSITIPMHYLVEGLNKGVFGKLSKVDVFLSEIALNVEKTNRFSFKRSDVDGDQRVVVLDTKR